jgi:signal peptidase I
MSLDYDFDRAERIEKRKKFFKKFFGWVFSLGLAVVLAWAITTYALEKTNMVGDSMEATLSSGDTILINKLLYRIKPPQRNDVIVFKKDGKEHSYYSIKTIIVMPGEHVLIAGGKIYIDGVQLEEVVNVDDIALAGLASDEIILDEDEYFVLGDNRNNSEDSRYFNVGNVFREEIVGKAWIRINRFGIISKLNRNRDDDKKSDKAEGTEETQEEDKKQ